MLFRSGQVPDYIFIFNFGSSQKTATLKVHVYAFLTWPSCRLYFHFQFRFQPEDSYTQSACLCIFDLAKLPTIFSFSISVPARRQLHSKCMLMHFWHGQVADYSFIFNCGSSQKTATLKVHAYAFLTWLSCRLYFHFQSRVQPEDSCTQSACLCIFDLAKLPSIFSFSISVPARRQLHSKCMFMRYTPG